MLVSIYLYKKPYFPFHTPKKEKQTIGGCNIPGGPQEVFKLGDDLAQSWPIGSLPLDLEDGSKNGPGTSLVVQWLRLQTLNTGGPGSIPGWKTRTHMPHTEPVLQGPGAPSTEPTCPNSWRRVPWSLCSEKPADRNKEWPPRTTARENPRSSEDPAQPK